MMPMKNITRDQLLNLLKKGMKSLEIITHMKGGHGEYHREDYFRLIRLNADPSAYIVYEYKVDYNGNGKINSVFENHWMKNHVKFYSDMEVLTKKIYDFIKKAKKDKRFDNIWYLEDGFEYINLVE